MRGENSEIHFFLNIFSSSPATAALGFWFA